MGLLNSGGLVSREGIFALLRAGSIHVDNYSDDDLIENGYRLRIKDSVMVAEDVHIIDLKDLSTAGQTKVRTLKIPEDGFVLRPGNLYNIPMTAVYPGKLAPVVFIDPEYARLGVFTTASLYYNQLVSGQGSLVPSVPIAVTLPVRIHSGISIATVGFIKLLER